MIAALRSSSSAPAPSVTISPGPRHRIGGDRRAAGQRLDDDESEGVGAAWKDKDVGARIGRSERFAAKLAQDDGVGMARRKVRARRAGADAHPGARLPRCEDGPDILFYHDAPDREACREK